MSLDVEKYRKKVKLNEPKFNMVPFIDILFTLMIFLIVTSSFSEESSQSGSGKPEQSDTVGPSEYYLVPVSGLKTVIVNDQNMSNLIVNSSIAVHTDVMDYGEITIKNKEKSIIITSPKKMPPEKAVKSPNR